VAVGARKPLIAFNVYLSGEEDDAKEVARAVRESSGGLPAVRGIGFAVPESGLVQVSMNLVDYETTGIAAALSSVRTEAARRGMEVMECEIVGLVPQAALDDAVRDLLALDGGFSPEHQVLERLVSAAKAPGIRSNAIDEFLEGVAGERPTPGGGSSAAVAGALGAALVAMVGRLTVGRAKYEAVAARMEELIAQVDAARQGFLALADRDAEAFDRVMAAMKMPKETAEQRASRSEAMGSASAEAADVPLRVARLAIEVLALAIEAIEIGNPNAASDGAAGAQVLAASARSAIYNVEINLGSLKDPAVVKGLRSDVDELTARAADLLSRADRVFHERLAE
jgi:glutamate formiminotransferase/formiminotetrahydrofolate cyclodeaminase